VYLLNDVYIALEIILIPLPSH